MREREKKIKKLKYNIQTEEMIISNSKKQIEVIKKQITILENVSDETYDKEFEI